MRIPFIIAAALVFVAVVVIVARRAKSPVPQQSPDEFMATMAAEAVSAAKDEFGVELDYSLESVQKVEDILGKLHKLYAARDDKGGLHGYAIAFGAYIGETIKRHTGRGHWERDHAVGGEKSWPFFWEDGDHVSFPYGWCGRRIQNGPEDNVWHKLQMVMSPATWSPGVPIGAQQEAEGRKDESKK